LQVGVASAASFKTLTLSSPGTSRIAFTALYGTKIVRLQEIGYGRIALASMRDVPFSEEIYVMNADGSVAARLTNNTVADREPAWSPDGRRIAFSSSRDGNSEIYIMNADGSGPTNLTNHVNYDVDPAWSPDGRRIAFESRRDGNPEVYVMDADGSAPTRLTDNPAADFEPCWSPDGRRIAFSSYRDGNYEVYVMNADGSGQTNLTNNVADDLEAAWSPDGRRIAFASTRNGANWEVYVVNADGSWLTRLTNNAAHDHQPAWSPDGRRMTFTTDREVNAEVYIMNADGSGQTNLTANGEYDAESSWCPAPSVVRGLIGANRSDGGSNPPFGAQRPLVIVGLNADGLVSATTIQLSTADWPSLGVTALKNIGTDLTGVKIKGNNIRQVIEDMGRGLPTRIWEVFGTPTTGAVLIFFDGATGRASSILAGADTALDTPAELAGGRVLLHGSYTEVYSAADPRRNLVSDPASQVTLNSHTGEVIAVN
jgi:dipeptidyl aminopeptidase/acylaminoacyl peptidase